jgi:hypothetical protein
MAGEIGMVSWSEAGISYLLAAQADDDFLVRIGEKIRHEPLDEIPPPPSAPTVSQPVTPPAAESGVTSSLPDSPSTAPTVSPPSVIAPTSPAPPPPLD